MLFCYGSLQNQPGPRDVEALRTNVPELLAVAREIRRRQPAGLAAYKPANSHPQHEDRAFDFVGMTGLPLVPCHEFPTNAPAAFFSVHALKDRELVPKLRAFIATGRPVLLTDGLAQSLTNQLRLDAHNVQLLPVQQDPKSLLRLEAAQLEKLRQPLLMPFKVNLRAPNRVALYLFADGSWVVENFNDAPAEVVLNGEQVTLSPRDWSSHWNKTEKLSR